MRRTWLPVLAAVLLLSDCSAMEGVETKAEYPVRRQGDGDTVYTQRGQGGIGNRDGIFGGGGLFGKDKDKAEGVGITVNAYLWRAALDTVSSMPLASADPFGGTIITDWYSPPETKGERVKATVIVMSRELRSDAIKVSVFRQVQAGGTWKDATVAAKTATDLENTILTRARQLKVADAEK